MSDQEQARLAQAIGDWLVATDDLLCHRHPRCTLCGAPQPTYFDIAVLDDGRGIAYRLCDRCHAQDRDLSQVAALLERRYRPQGEGKS